ncbi:MAG: hypothetical protein ACP5MZ_04490 [Candidatus Micrarchaeia archaeon]
MKLQAAIVEAALATSLLVLSSTAITSIAYNTAGAGKGPAQQVNAAYDLLRIVQGNTSYAQCIISGGTCAETELGEIKEIYGLDYIGIDAEGLNAHAGSAAVCSSEYRLCEPIELGGYNIMCVYTCSG